MFSRNPSSTLDAAIRKHSLNVCGGGGGESRRSPTHSPLINPDAAAAPSENDSLHRQMTNNDSPETALPRQKTNKYSPVVATPNAINNTAVSDTWLGALFLNTLPGLLFYTPTFIMPLITIFAALGAIYTPLLLITAAQLPLIAAFPSLATALIAMGSQQPWVTLVTVLISFSTAWYAFLLIPALDYFMGNELRNATPEEIQKASDSGRDRWRYRVLLYAYAAVHITALTLVCHVMCTHAAAVGGVATAAFLGAAVSSGIANGLLYTISHELLHGCRYERIAATALLAPVAYMHWTKSHIAHHIKVGTPEDPSTARKGETLWAFIPRSIWGNLRDGWAAEATRRRAKGISSWDVLRNRVFLWVGAPVALAAMATLVYGQHGLAFFLLQAGVGTFLIKRWLILFLYKLI